MSNTEDTKVLKKNPLVFVFESVFFNVRWILNWFYLGLIAALCIYTYTYTIELVRLFRYASVLNADMMMLKILEMVDIVMVANLVKMVITGSYHSFVSKDHGFKNENASSGVLKIKMATSIVGVSSIHLLHSFIEAKVMPREEVMTQIYIHVTLLVGAVLLSVIEYIHIKTEILEGKHAAH